MFTTKIKLNCLGTLAILALAAIPGFASPIIVSNFSFEDLPIGVTPSGCGNTNCFYTVGPIAGWTATGATDFGQFHPGAPVVSNYFTALSDGPTSAYINDNGGALGQTIGNVVQGEVYTLLVDIGYRLDLGFGGSAALQIGGPGPGAQLIAATGTQPTRGTFGTFSATYIGLSTDVGKSISINLISSGPQANFDNVRLDASLAPEPVPFMLIGTALLVLPALSRRRKNSKTPK